MLEERLCDVPSQGAFPGPLILLAARKVTGYFRICGRF